MSLRTTLIPVTLALLLESLPVPAATIGTTFHYQGRLRQNGLPATGAFDLQFRLWTDAALGSQQGPTLNQTNFAIADGLVSTSLDFGVGVFDGTAYWIEVGVRTNGSTAAFETLRPRQAVTTVPYTLFSTRTGTADSAAHASTANSVPWSGITGMPAGFADGTDDGATVTAGLGLALDGTALGIATNNAGNGKALVFTGTTVVWSNVSWSNLVNIPPDFADGTDDGSVYTAGTGLSLVGSQFSVSFGGTGAAVSAARSDHAHTTYAPTSHTHAGSQITSAVASAAAAAAVPWAGITGLPSGFADGIDNDTTYTAGTGLALATTTFSIASGGVGTTQLADSAVTAAKFADAGVTAVKLANRAVTTNKLDYTGATNGQALLFNGTTVVWTNLSWSNLVNIPSGFADGTDSDTTYTAGSGLSLVSGQFNVSFSGTGAAATASRSDHNHTGVYANSTHAHSGADITSGTVADARIDAALTRDTEVMTIVKANDGTGSTVDADLIDGLDSTAFWKAGGNSGTTAGTHFVGTTDNQPLELKANNQRVARYVPTSGAQASEGPTIIQGYSGNTAAGGTLGGTIGGGGKSGAVNAVAGSYASVGGGMNNRANSDYATVGGGQNNLAASAYAVAGGGSGNTATNSFTVVAGGMSNMASTEGAAIVGGAVNLAAGFRSFIGGGENNRTAISFDVVGGGAFNQATGGASFVGGGLTNLALGWETTIGGGEANYIDANVSRVTISGGWSNRVEASAWESAIGGGKLNRILANGVFGTIAGGAENLVIGDFGGSATITGGARNAAVGGASVGGGEDNKAYAWSSTIGGGQNNFTSTGCSHATIAGGFWNQMDLDSSEATIGGGKNNFIGTNSSWTTIAGGVDNSIGAWGGFSSIGGGQGNQVWNGAGWSTIPGGLFNTVAAQYCFAAGRRAKAWHPGTFVWADATDADFGSTGNNQFLVRAGGGVGINVTSPLAMLDVGGGDALVRGTNFTTVGATAKLNLGDGNHFIEATYSGGMRLGVWGAFDGIVLKEATGNVGIGRTASGNRFEVEGDASKAVAGSWLANSDRRIKTDVATVTNALETLDRVRLASFRYTDEYRAQHPSIEDRPYLNVIAQEFQEVFPEYVKGSGDKLPNGDEILQVDTYPLTIYSAAAIQELKQQVDEKESRIAKLESQVTELRALVTALGRAEVRP